MEDGLVQASATELKKQFDVLILVVMEDGLVLKFQKMNVHPYGSLNPCCNGRWSRTSVDKCFDCI